MSKIAKLYYLFSNVKALTPKYLWVEPTNKCNFKCDICPVNSIMKRKKGFMDENLFKNIVDQAKSIGVKGITITTWGEPLMHPKINNFIKYTAKSGIKARIITNGSLLTGKNSKQLIQCGLDSIVFSIYGDEYDYKKRASISFDEIKRKWLFFVKMRDKLNPKLKIIFRHVITDENNDKVNNLIEQWSYLCDEFELQQETIFGKDIIYNRKFSCPNLWLTPNILWDGKVVPCCADYDGDFIIGDITKESIKKIWNNYLIKNIRKLHRKKDFPKRCFRCVERIPSRYVGYTLSFIIIKKIKNLFQINSRKKEIK